MSGPVTPEPHIVCPRCSYQIPLTGSLAAPLPEAARKEFHEQLTVKETEFASAAVDFAKPRTDLLDHLVGPAEHREWHADAECLGCLEIDDQLNLCRLLHGQVGGLVAFQYSASKNSGGAVGILDAAAVTHEAAVAGKLIVLIDGRHCVATRRVRWRHQRRPKATLGGSAIEPVGCIYRRAAHPLLGESGRICKSGCGEIDSCPINGRS
jgi:hypothetical protein